jgi:alpha-L-fucosidase
MKPQMKALFYKYDADILWCDVGGPTVFPDIGESLFVFILATVNCGAAPAWFNWAKKNGRQVMANARCGANYSDFDNPEYSATSHLSTFTVI